MPSYTTTLRNNRLDEITALIDAGGAAGGGFVRIYDDNGGGVPANVGATLGSSVLLAELELSDPSAAAAAGGVLTFNAITDDTSANASGTATFARITDSDGNAVVQITAGDSGTELLLDNAAINSGQTVSITSATITEGNS